VWCLARFKWCPLWDIILVQIHLSKGNHNVSRVLRSVKRILRDASEDEEMSYYKFRKVVVDLDVIRAFFSEGLPTRRYLDYHLGLLEGLGYLDLFKLGDARQSHVYPKLTKKGLKRIGEYDFFRDDLRLK